MSSRGAVIVNNNVTDANVVMQIALLVDVRSCDVGISRKRQC